MVIWLLFRICKWTVGSVKKLVPNLMDKNNYVIHYRNLQQCLEFGLKLKNT